MIVLVKQAIMYWLVVVLSLIHISPPSEYVLTGTRLLYVSRQVLQNLYSLSYAYRMSKMDLYLDVYKRQTGNSF